MTEKKLCEMCTEYNADHKCENKDKCELLAVLRENRQLKKVLRKVRKECFNLVMEKSWRNSPDMMGK